MRLQGLGLAQVQNLEGENLQLGFEPHRVLNVSETIGSQIEASINITPHLHRPKRISRDILLFSNIVKRGATHFLPSSGRLNPTFPSPVNRRLALAFPDRKDAKKRNWRFDPAGSNRNKAANTSK